MRKVIDSFVGLLAGLGTVLIINELLQGAAANIILGQPMNFSFNGIKLEANFIIEPSQFWGSLFVIITPVLSSIIFIEIVIIALAKRGSDNFNIVLLVFQLVNTGFLLVYTVTGIMSLLITKSMTHDFVGLLQSAGYSHNRQLVFMLMLTFFLFGYINIILKRMRKNLPAIIENKMGNSDGSKK